MKATIITFSPSKNTLKVSELVKSKLDEKGIKTQLINISGEKDIFVQNNISDFLEKKVEEHDLLLIGAPVYAHHLQYHAIELIQSLPAPEHRWGAKAIPFVTYGGICSGVALEEASRLLKKSGRAVPAAMKISASHTMSGAFMEEKYNKEKPGDECLPVIDQLVARVEHIKNLKKADNVHRKIKYSSISTRIKAKFIFKEKEWHEKRYPKIEIDTLSCTNCGACTKVCPVAHLIQNNDKSISRNNKSDCIHCFNCVGICPNKAIRINGDLEKARKFFNKMIAKGKELPESAVYPIRENEKMPA